MVDDQTIEILKNAILLEKRGQAFYENVAQQASGKAVKEFFEMMANEEKNHIRILSDQYAAYQASQQFNANQLDEQRGSDIAPQVLSQKIKDEITAADYEAAAIAAAVSMEENAVKLYSDRAAAATDPNEKALYDWLAKWERQHLNFLSDIDQELTERIWYDQNFWPF